nr:reverse transcriptase domain-containing protein [Tanacetum cinerariifolium]
QRHHNGPCTQKCHKCNKVGHFAPDCRSSGNANVANAQRDGNETPKGNGCFECEASGHFKRDCPKLRNKNGGNRNAQGWVQIMAPVTRQGHNQPPPNTDTPPHHMTPESVQAMIDQALLRNSTNEDGIQSSHEDNPRNVHTTRPCFYADFIKCHPLNFKGNEGIVSLTRWIEKMESVFNISGCAIENQVKFATCTLLDAALTWWNSQIKTLGPEAYAMT